MKLVGFETRNLIGGREGVDFGQKKSVIGINVADTGETELVVKQVFDGARGALKLTIEISGGEPRRKKIVAKSGLKIFDLRDG